MALSGRPQTIKSAMGPFHALLESTTACLLVEDLLGCRAWVINNFIDAGELLLWANEKRVQQCLSIRELARRAQALEHRLERGIRHDIEPAQDLEQYLASSHTSGQSAPNEPHGSPTREDKDGSRDRILTCISHIYALAILTYVYVTVEGFQPHMPEIYTNVRRTLGAFRAIPPHEVETVMPRLIWPLTITGFMVGDDAGERHTVRRLVILSIDGTDTTTSAPSSAASTLLTLMDNVWAQASLGLSPDDFKTAINSLGFPVLLI